jgi:cytidine deaminase
MCLVVTVEFDQHAVYYAGEPFRCEITFSNMIYDERAMEQKAVESMNINALELGNKIVHYEEKRWQETSLEKHDATLQPCRVCSERSEAVQWATTQLLGYFVIDKGLVKEEAFQNLLPSVFQKATRSRTLSLTSLPHALSAIPTERTTFPVFSTNPLILCVDIELQTEQKKSCK